MKTLRLFLGKAPTGLLSCAAFRRERYCATDVVVGLVGLGNASVEKSVKLGYHQVGVNILNFLLDAEYPTLSVLSPRFKVLQVLLKSLGMRL